MKKIILLILIGFSSITAQEENYPVEIYLLDSFVTPELPHTMMVSFITSEEATSKIVIQNEYEYEVSTEFTDTHEFELDVTNSNFDSMFVSYQIIATDKEGKEYTSEVFEVELPNVYKLRTDSDQGLLIICCFGGIIFGLPTASYASFDGENHFALSKEIPFLSFYTRGVTKPSGYFSVGYTHIFDAPKKNFLRFGYKEIFYVPGIEYVSPGINAFTDFSGFNGFSPELSIGWFEIYNIFTVYSRYRFNFQPGNGTNNFHEVSIGLFSNFFSLNL